MSILIRFLKDQRGATAIEYALIASIVSVGILAALLVVSEDVRSLFARIASALTG